MCSKSIDIALVVCHIKHITDLGHVYFSFKSEMPFVYVMLCANLKFFDLSEAVNIFLINDIL